MVCEAAERLCALDVVDSGEQLCQCAPRRSPSRYYCGRHGPEPYCSLHYQLLRNRAIGGIAELCNGGAFGQAGSNTGRIDERDIRKCCRIDRECDGTTICHQAHTDDS